MFCPECGLDHHMAERAEREETERAADREVEIERLRTKRDIEVARIQANAAEHIAEDEAAVDVAHAEGEADGMRDVLDAIGGGDAEPEPEPEGAPIVVEPEPEPEPDMVPPETEHHREPAKRNNNLFGF